MQMAVGSDGADGPEKRPRHYSYDESVDEPGKLVEEESVEIEREIPAEDTDPIEQSEREDTPAPPVFED